MTRIYLSGDLNPTFYFNSEKLNRNNFYLMKIFFLNVSMRNPYDFSICYLNTMLNKKKYGY